MNRKTAKLLLQILEQELTPILKAHGVEFDMGDIEYDDNPAIINGHSIASWRIGFFHVGRLPKE
jgi:hypothetical protein